MSIFKLLEDLSLLATDGGAVQILLRFYEQEEGLVFVIY